MEKRKLASIQYVHHVTQIDGADKIECVHVLGWKCVANKGQFHVGDHCVYMEVDSFLPNLTITSECPAKHGISGQKGANNYYDKSIIHLPRQQVAFSKESSKYAGCGILKRNFYTRFIPIFKDFGL